MHSLIVILGAATILLVARLRARPTAEPAERRQWVVDEFARRKLRQVTVAIPIIVVVATMFWAQHHPQYGLTTLLSVAAVVAVVAGAVFSYHNWRCPACGCYLGRYAWMSGRCQHCHTALR